MHGDPEKVHMEIRPMTLLMEEIRFLILEMNHMIMFSPDFISYSTLSVEQHIIVANEARVLIVGLGNIQLQPSLSLHNILHVPKLTNNLVNKIFFLQQVESLVSFNLRGSVGK
ncbi:hypothetical protein CR513_29054, partial [Mucuna pruriens]